MVNDSKYITHKLHICGTVASKNREFDNGNIFYNYSLWLCKRRADLTGDVTDNFLLVDRAYVTQS